MQFYSIHADGPTEGWFATDEEALAMAQGVAADQKCEVEVYKIQNFFGERINTYIGSAMPNPDPED